MQRDYFIGLRKFAFETINRTIWRHRPPKLTVFRKLSFILNIFVQNFFSLNLIGHFKVSMLFSKNEFPLELLAFSKQQRI